MDNHRNYLPDRYEEDPGKRKTVCPVSTTASPGEKMQSILTHQRRILDAPRQRDVLAALIDFATENGILNNSPEVFYKLRELKEKCQDQNPKKSG